MAIHSPMYTNSPAPTSPKIRKPILTSVGERGLPRLVIPRFQHLPTAPEAVAARGVVQQQPQVPAVMGRPGLLLRKVSGGVPRQPLHIVGSLEQQGGRA